MNNKKIEIIEFTDPVCTWCWGSEPILRKLETKYAEQVELKYIMGGLVKDIREFYDSYNDIGKDPQKSNKQIVKHWLEASAMHGMPVESNGFHLFSDEYPSTYPQNIAYKAAQMENQVLADKFLRRMREAAATEAKQINRLEVQIELASEIGLDIEKFIERMTNKSAESAFYEDLRIIQQYGVHGFPTFLVRFGKKEMLLRGYQKFEAFNSVIESISEGTIKERKIEKTQEEFLAFIRKYSKVAQIELKVSFDLSEDECEQEIDTLIQKGLCRKIEAGNGFYIEAITNPILCNSVTGICNI